MKGNIVFLISGKAGSGKGEVGKALEEELTKDGYPVLTIAFADMVKECARLSGRRLKRRTTSKSSFSINLQSVMKFISFLFLYILHKRIGFSFRFQGSRIVMSCKNGHIA